MEYSSTKKARLPGIPFDFDDDSDDDDDYDDVDGRVDQGAVVDEDGHGRRTRDVMGGENISPTTRRLHVTANALVDSAGESMLEKAEDFVASVYGGVVGAFKSSASSSPWRTAKGEDGRRGLMGNADVHDDRDENEGGISHAKGGGGEQTAVLDDAAVYIARMESLYAMDAMDDVIVERVAVGEEGNEAESPNDRGGCDDDDDVDAVAKSGVGGGPEDCKYRAQDGNDEDDRNDAVSHSHDERANPSTDINQNLSSEDDHSNVDGELSCGNVCNGGSNSMSGCPPTLENESNGSISFYLDIHDGFIPSSSIDDSDLSVTASASASCDDYDDDDCTIFDEENEVMTKDSNFGRDYNMTESEEATISHPLFTPSNPSLPEMIICEDEQSVPFIIAVGNDDDLDDEVASGSSCSHREACDDEEATTTVGTAVLMTPIRSKVQPSLRDTDDSSRHDYVPTSLMRMLHRQESEFTRIMSSVDALAATPERIANRLFLENDDDGDDDDVNLMVNVGDDGENDHSGEQFTTVKRRLMLESDACHDNVDSNGDITTYVKSRRRTEEPSLSVDGGVIPADAVDESSPSVKLTLASFPSSLLRAHSSTMSDDLPRQSKGEEADDTSPPPPQNDEVSQSASVRSNDSSILMAPLPSVKFSQDESLLAIQTVAIGSDVDETLRQCILKSPEEKPSSTTMDSFVEPQQEDSDFTSGSQKRRTFIDDDLLRAQTAMDGENYDNEKNNDEESSAKTSTDLSCDIPSLHDANVAFQIDFVSLPPTTATAEMALMTTGVKGNYDERVGKERRLVVSETAVHELVFPAKDHLEKEKVTIETDFDSTTKHGSVLKRELAEIDLPVASKRAEKDVSLLNESFDTAFCSLGAIERAGIIFFESNERVGNNSASSTSAQGYVDSHSLLVNMRTDVIHDETSWTQTPGRKTTRGISTKSEEVEPPGINKTINMNERSLIPKKAGYNDTRNRKNRGKNGNSSALASALIECEKIHTIDSCNATNNANDVDENATSSAINEGIRYLVASPEALFENSLSEHCVVVSTLSPVKDSSIDGGDQFTEVSIVPDVCKTSTGSSKQHVIASKSHENTSEVDILKLDNVHTIDGSVQGTNITSSSEKSAHEDDPKPPLNNDILIDSFFMVKADPIHCATIDEDSRPSSAATEKFASDESVFNESMFMPNSSVDCTHSPEPKIIMSTAVESMPGRSGDESDENEDDEDDEAFFPNPDHSTKTKSTAGANNQIAKVECISRADATTHIANGNEKPEMKPVAPDHSTPSSARANTLRVRQSLTSKAVASGQSFAAESPREPTFPRNAKNSILLVNQETVSRSISKLSSPREGNDQHAVLSGTSMPCKNISKQQANRKTVSRLSPPSAIKPARKKSKITVPFKISPVVECEENIKSLMRTGSTPAIRQSKVISASSNKAIPSIREMRGRTSYLAVRATGKENIKSTFIAKADMEHSVYSLSSRSMKHSLVSIARETRERGQSKSNINSLGEKNLPKVLVDMARLDRLAQPRFRHSIAIMTDPCPINNTKKNATRPVAPPSFLSRPVSSRQSIKSTEQLELEEMERTKPFKARGILGSSAEVKSRFKSAMPRHLAPSLTAAPSPSGEFKPIFKASPAARSTPSISRASGFYKPKPQRERVNTFGESVQNYLNHGLRGSTPSKAEMTLNLNPPSFLHRQSLSHSTKAKTSEEMELDECKKQFRARTIGYGASSLQAKHNTLGLDGKTPQRKRSGMLTTPSPFRLDVRVGSTRPRPLSTDEIELSKKFKALPLPNSSARLIKSSIHTAHKHHEVARHRKDMPNAGEGDRMFKAKPVPKTTYLVVDAVKKTTHVLTQPNPPRLSLLDRAEARKLFDLNQREIRNADNAMKEVTERQKKDMEEEEIRIQRRKYADEGGFCFKAKQIGIEYI